MFQQVSTKCTYNSNNEKCFFFHLKDVLNTNKEGLELENIKLHSIVKKTDWSTNSLFKHNTFLKRKKSM